MAFSLFSRRLFLFLLSFTAGSLSHAQIKDTHNHAKNQNFKTKRIVLPLPEPEVVRLQNRSIDETIQKIYVTHDYKSDINSKLLVKNIDAIDAHKNVLRKVLDGTLEQTKGVPFDQIRLDFNYYGFGDPELTKLVIEARKKKINVRFISDFNRSLTYPFKEGEDLTSDFANAKYQDNLTAQTLQELRKNGMEYGKDLLSPPLMNDYNDKKMIDIYHLKNTIVSIKQPDGTHKPVFEFFGSGNMSGGTLRNNLMFETTIPEIMAHKQAYIESCAKGFKNGKRIMDVDEVVPKKFIFRDGELTTYFTSGKHNPYEAVIGILNKGVNDPDNFKIQEIVYSENVMTNHKFVDAIKMLKAKQDFRQLGIIDVTNLKAPAIAPVLGGVDVYTSYDDIIKGIYSTQIQNDKLYAWEKKDHGKKILDVDGYPDAQELWHNKTMLINTAENGVKYTYLVTGTFNVSNHIENAEILQVYKFNADAEIPLVIRESVLKAIETYPQFAIPIDQATFQSHVSTLFARTPFDVPLEMSNELLNTMRKGDVDASVNILNKIMKMPTDIKNPLSLEKGKKRIEIFRQVFEKNLSYPGAKDAFEEASINRLSQYIIAASEKVQGKAFTANLRQISSPVRAEETEFYKRVEEMRKILKTKRYTPKENPKFLPATCLSSDLKTIVN